LIADLILLSVAPTRNLIYPSNISCNQYWGYESALRAAKIEHPDLAPMCDSVLETEDAVRQQDKAMKEKEKSYDTSIRLDNVDVNGLHSFLDKYGPLQLRKYFGGRELLL